MCSKTKWAIMQFILFLALLAMPLNSHAELFMSVSGKVVAADNGAALGGVRILLVSKLEPEKGKIAEVKSRPDGVFWLKGIPKGMYDIWAVSEDPYVVTSNTTVPVTVLDGKNVVGVAVKMQRGGAVKGRIVTETGSPVPQASVIAGSSSSVTDTEGNFILKSLPAGSVKIAILAAGIGTKTISVSTEVAKLTDIGNIELRISQETSIVGSIVDSTGAAIPDAIVIASSTEGSFGYATTVNNGKFFILGLQNSYKYKLTVISFGYEKTSLSDVTVPSTDLKIQLTKLPEQVASTNHYRLTFADNDVESFYTIIPAAYRSCSKGSCSDGNWGATSADLTGLFPTGVLAQGGGSYSVGMFACASNLQRLDFASFCTYLGPSTSILSLNLSWSVGYCSACCTEDLLGSSTGGYISYKAASGAWDISSSSKCFWGSLNAPLIPDSKVSGLLSQSKFLDIFMYLYKNPLNNFNSYLPSASGVIRKCDTEELVNFVEYYAERYPWLKKLIFLF